MKVNHNLTLHVYPTESTDKIDDFLLVEYAKSLFEVEDEDTLEVTYEVPNKVNFEDDAMKFLTAFSSERTFIRYTLWCVKSYSQSIELNIAIPMDIYNKLFDKGNDEIGGFLKKPIMIGEIPVYIYKRTDLVYYSRIDLDRLVKGRVSTLSDFNYKIADFKLACAADEKIEFYDLERYLHINSTTFEGVRQSSSIAELQTELIKDCNIGIPNGYTCDYDKFMHIRKEEKE